MLSESETAMLLQEVANDFGENLGDSAISSWRRALDPNITLPQAMQAVAHLAGNPSNGVYRLRPSDINAEIQRQKRSHDSTRSQIDAWLEDRRIGGQLGPDWTSKRVQLYKAIYKAIDAGETIEQACIHSVRRLYPEASISVAPRMTFQEWYKLAKAKGIRVNPMLLMAFGTPEQKQQAEAQMKAGK